MKLNKIIASVLLGISIIGVTGCGMSQEQIQENQNQVAQKQNNYVSRAYFTKHIINNDYKVGDIVHVSSLELWAEEYQNYEDGEFLFLEHVFIEKHMYTIKIRLKGTSCKKFFTNLKNKNGKIEFMTIENLNFKINNITVNEGYGDTTEINVYGEE